MGYWIGREAVRVALREWDRVGMQTRVMEEVLRHWGLGSVAELVALGNQRGHAEGASGPDFAELAPVVMRCAEEGDGVAARVLERAGEELADLVEVVWGKMQAAGGSSAGMIGVAYAGSVLGQIERVRAAMAARLAVRVPAARVGEAAVDPLDGALWRARHFVPSSTLL
jgi:N-acetylglucosamine kinase-like BadF-type ATPase